LIIKNSTILVKGARGKFSPIPAKLIANFAADIKKTFNRSGLEIEALAEQNY
jgi:hypothetical protein